MIEITMHEQIKENFLFFIFLLIGVFISTILWIAGGDKLSSITVGLCLTMIGIMTQVKQYKEHISQLYQTENELTRDEWLYTRISQIAKDYYKARDIKNPLFAQRARTIVENCLRDLDKLSDGTYYGSIEEDKPHSIEIMKLAQVTVKATSYVHISWWTDESGQKYLKEQQEILNRGCQIDKVFLVDELDDTIKSEIKKQIALGIKIWIAAVTNLPNYMREDFLISDDNVISISEVNREGRTKRVKTSIDPWLVAKYVGYFNSLLLSSRRINTEEELESIVINN